MHREVPGQTTPDMGSWSESGCTDAQVAAAASAAARGAGSDAGGGAPAGRKGEPETPLKGNAAKQRCKACLKSLPCEDFALNSPYCRVDKQAIDNLAYHAKVQNELEWWKDARGDDTKLRRVLFKYHERCPREPNARRRSTFLIAQYREEYRAASAVTHSDKGVMMHRTRYIRYATTPGTDASNPAMTVKDAELKWAAWENDPAHIRDQKGPVGDTLRLRVHVDDEVNFDSSVTHSKSQTLQSRKDDKNVAEEDAQRERRSLLRSHNRDLGKDAAEEEYTAIAQAMLARTDGTSGAASAVFAGSGLAIPDVARLAEEIAEEDKPKDKKAKSASGESLPTEGDVASASGTASSAPGADSEAGKSGGRKRKWVDATVIVAKKRRTIEEKNEKLVESLTSAVESAQAKLSEIDCLLETERRRYSTERETLGWRVQWAVACLNPECEAGEAAIAQLGMHVRMKTKCPPCEGWDELRSTGQLTKETASTFDHMAAAQTAATSLEEVAEAARRLEARWVPLAKLVKSVSRGVADVKVAQAATARVQKQRLAQEAKQTRKAEAVPKGSSRGGCGPTSPAALARPIFEHASACGREVARYGSLAELSQQDLDLTAPLILRDAALGNILDEVGGMRLPQGLPQVLRCGVRHGVLQVTEWVGGSGGRVWQGVLACRGVGGWRRGPGAGLRGDGGRCVFCCALAFGCPSPGP